MVSVLRGREGAAGGREAMAEELKPRAERRSEAVQAKLPQRGSTRRHLGATQLGLGQIARSRLLRLDLAVQGFRLIGYSSYSSLYTLQDELVETIACTSLHPRLFLLSQLHRTPTASPSSFLRFIGRV